MWPFHHIKLYCTALLLLSGTNDVCSQCVPTGATLPSTLTNNTSVGSVGWSNLLNGISSNNSYASCGTLLGILGSAQTNYIQAWNYGLAIPATATVCGIEVKVERNAGGLLIGSSVRDQNLFLMKGGVAAGTNHASSSSWAGSDAIAVYGNNSDLWGTTWTPSEINASNFGVELSAQLNAGLASLFLSANVDAISVTVYYTASVLPVEFISFNGEQHMQSVRLEWKTASEKDNARFDVEKMNEDYSWNVMESVPAKGNSSTINTYVVSDKTPSPINYYRIRQVDKNRNSSLSEIIAVEYQIAGARKPLLYPTPASTFLHVEYSQPMEKLEIISAEGMTIHAEFQEQENAALINTSSLAAGMYFLKIYTRSDVLITRFIKE